MLHLFLATAIVLAAAPPRWSAPEMLWEAPAKTWLAIDADAWGRVHVFWTEQMVDPDGGETTRPAIYHTHFDGAQWSPPAPLFVAEPGAFLAARLDARSTADGWLYLVWSNRGGIQLSRAPCAAAGDRAYWEEAREIARAPGADIVRLAARADGDLHLVYTRLWGDDGAKSGRVEHTASRDGGGTWSAPKTLSRIAEDPIRAAGGPRLLLDRDTAVHVVWDERSGPSWLGDRIVYARSDDDGRTWEAPLTLAEKGDAPAGRRTAPSLAKAAGELHVVYSCDTPVRRCTRLSADDGVTWSPQQDFPLGDLVGLAEWDALLADAGDNLHFVTQMRTPRGMYYTTKPPGRPWSAPLFLDAPLGWDDAHAPEMALSLGNTLHVVWDRSDYSGDVIHATIETTAAATTAAAALPPPAKPSPPTSRRAMFAALAGAALLAGLSWVRRRRLR